VIAAFSGLLDVVRIDRPVELPPRHSLCLQATAQLPLIRLLAALALIVPRHSGPKSLARLACGRMLRICD
jgi:hypothetical protein